ncbi:MAG: outer membrane protein assembly factor BamD [Bdellovibrionaceae bacterium]|nr:outer membrane protein assembly factor BamD [Pseudobdellovibrionaceae bacterium]
MLILSLTAAVLLVSGEAKVFLGEAGTVTSLEIESLRRDLKSSELRETLAREQIYDYQQSVLKTLAKDRGPKNWQELSLVSQARALASVEEVDLSASMLAAGKDEFNAGKYVIAAQKFLAVTEKYPASPSALEARFLRAESLYLSGQMDPCVEQIDEMMTQFPDHPMTGYLMLRLSQIMKSRSRTLEAREILQMIPLSFPKEVQLIEQARSLEGDIRIL